MAIPKAVLTALAALRADPATMLSLSQTEREQYANLLESCLESSLSMPPAPADLSTDEPEPPDSAPPPSDNEDRKSETRRPEFLLRIATDSYFDLSADGYDAAHLDDLFATKRTDARDAISLGLARGGEVARNIIAKCVAASTLDFEGDATALTEEIMRESRRLASWAMCLPYATTTKTDMLFEFFKVDIWTNAIPEIAPGELSVSSSGAHKITLLFVDLLRASTNFMFDRTSYCARLIGWAIGHGVKRTTEFLTSGQLVDWSMYPLITPVPSVASFQLTVGKSETTSRPPLLERLRAGKPAEFRLIGQGGGGGKPVEDLKLTPEGEIVLPTDEEVKKEINRRVSEGLKSSFVRREPPESRGGIRGDAEDGSPFNKSNTPWQPERASGGKGGATPGADGEDGTGSRGGQGGKGGAGSPVPTTHDKLFPDHIFGIDPATVPTEAIDALAELDRKNRHAAIVWPPSAAEIYENVPSPLGTHPEAAARAIDQSQQLAGRITSSSPIGYTPKDFDKDIREPALAAFKKFYGDEPVHLYARPLGNMKFGLRATSSYARSWLAYWISEARKDAHARDEATSWPLLVLRPTGATEGVLDAGGKAHGQEIVVTPISPNDDSQTTDLVLENIRLAQWAEGTFADSESIAILHIGNVGIPKNDNGLDVPKYMSPEQVIEFELSLTKQLMRALERGDIKMQVKKTSTGLGVTFEDDADGEKLEDELPIPDGEPSGHPAGTMPVILDATIDKLIDLFARRSRVTREEARVILEGRRG